MDQLNRAALEERVMILAPTGRDSALAVKTLRAAGFQCENCGTVAELCGLLRKGAGAALIADEAVAELADTDLLRNTVLEGPPWSDLPLIILTMGDRLAATALHDDALLADLGNVTFLERPLRAQTLITAVNSALRARRRQYEVRDLLLSQQQAVERMDLLAEVASHLLLTEKPQEVVASVFRKIAHHLGLEVYLYYLYDEAKECLRLSSHAGLPESMAAEREWLALHASFCGSVAQQQKRVIAEDIQSSNDPSTEHVRSLGITAYACFPLLTNGRLIGTLSFGTRHRRRFEHEELAMMETVCNQVAVAIERKHTEEALQDLNQLLENRVQERTAQLQETNEQMEAFTYSISHDLRAPLRAIRGFAQALAEDYGPSLDATGRDYLDRMSAGAERLDQLIQDLLQYSRLSRSRLTFEPVSLEASIRRVLQQLDADVQATGAQVEIQTPLPEVLGHAPTLEQVLINLVSNALKFVAPGVKPHVRIWGTLEGSLARLWIGDNGIGIAPAHHQRIFGVFERLHSGETYPGTGIGLAIVSKGITRMGGRAGVESVPGEGSRFWIELPQVGTRREEAAAA